jgi:putative transposase
MPPDWGGPRSGAGRPPIAGRRPPVPHRARPTHTGRFPVHVTLRAAPGLPSLRSPRAFVAIRKALAAGSSDGFRVLQFSVQHDHVHCIIEARDHRRLCLGIRGLMIRIARSLNNAIGRNGRVWGDRYHARHLRTPTEMRAALLYVLQNWKKHIRGAGGVDDRSSGPWFAGWATPLPSSAESSPVATPQTWLAASGWREKGGGPIRLAEAPSGRR